MDEEELVGYYDGLKSIKVYYTHSYVDYEDIENPLKSIIRGMLKVAIQPDKFLWQRT